MANALDNLKGEQFGFLSVVERLPSDVHNNVWWRCTCVCGATKLVRASCLRKGKFFHCGRIECRFWSKVYQAPGDSCWEWTGALKDSGHGVFSHLGRAVQAHQFAWELAHGALPQGAMLRHQCDNASCVRPSHLLPGTHQQNMDDMVSRGRACHTNGHPVITPELAQELRVEYKPGRVTQKQLAARYGLSSSLVRRVLTGKTWAQVH
jgi:hypothetical protein